MTCLATAARIAELHAVAHGHEAAAHEAKAKAYALKGEADRAKSYRLFAASSRAFELAANERARALIARIKGGKA